MIVERIELYERLNLFRCDLKLCLSGWYLLFRGVIRLCVNGLSDCCALAFPVGCVLCCFRSDWKVSVLLHCHCATSLPFCYKKHATLLLLPAFMLIVAVFDVL